MEKELENLIEAIRTHPRADLYRTAWGNSSTFDALPVVSRADMAATPLDRRLYKEGRGMAKIVHTPISSFISIWDFSDIGAEPFGIASSRPMSNFSDPREGIEKAMWCYEHNMVPLIGEQSPSVAILAARVCDIDSLITDSRSLSAFLPYLQERTTPLECISVVDDDLSAAALTSAAKFAKRVRLVLALPEIGAFAETTPDMYPTFSVLPNCILQEEDGLILTKIAHLVTPIIRYRTGFTGLLGKNGARTFALA
ncbi:MAG: hypothetical protein WC050_00955 [Candidatus Paceibacterota bacterium]